MSPSATSNTRSPGNQTVPWLRTLRCYITFVAAANLVWEFAHILFYTLWETGSTGEIVFAAVIGLMAAFLAGAVSFVSPCVLPLVPGYISYFAGHAGAVAASDRDRREQAIGMSLYFVLGFSTIFMTLGASATALGQMLLSYRYELNLIGGGLVVLFGLFMIGMARIEVMQREARFHLSIPGGRPVSAYVLGLAFGFGWTPCIGRSLAQF